MQNSIQTVLYAAKYREIQAKIAFSLGMNSISEHHGSFSGILSSGIMGGAITPVMIGGVADIISLRIGMILIF